MSRHATLRVDQVTTRHMRHARSQFAFFKARRSLALLSDVLATVDCHLHLKGRETPAKLNISRFAWTQSILLSFDCKLGLINSPTSQVTRCPLNHSPIEYDMGTLSTPSTVSACPPSHVPALPPPITIPLSRPGHRRHTDGQYRASSTLTIPHMHTQRQLNCQRR
jgi:hypothetical protein